MLLNKYDHKIFAERLCLRILENGDDTIGSIFFVLVEFSSPNSQEFRKSVTTQYDQLPGIGYEFSGKIPGRTHH
jgi:hypothetical protein